MESTWTELVGQASSWWKEHKDTGQLGAAIVGLLSAVITLLTALIQRASVRVGPGDDAAARPRLAVSLKSLLKGWISTLIWMVVAGVVFNAIVTGLILKRQDQSQQVEVVNTPTADQSEEALRLSLSGELPPHPIGKTQPKQTSVAKDSVDRIREMTPGEFFEGQHSILEQYPQLQVAFLVLLGLVYARGSYIAASSARTTYLMKLAHGLVAVASLELALGVVLSDYVAQDVYSSTYAPTIVAQWGMLTLMVGCVLGSILGSED